MKVLESLFDHARAYSKPPSNIMNIAKAIFTRFLNS